MRLVIFAAALAALAGGGALAKEAPNAAQAAKDAVVSDAGQAPKTLYICEDSAETRRAFAREYGAIEFVKAGEVRAGGEAWSTPKCITSVEARRLKAKRLASAR